MGEREEEEDFSLGIGERGGVGVGEVLARAGKREEGREPIEDSLADRFFVGFSFFVLGEGGGIARAQIARM